jgi:hypothetical protein
MPRKKKPASAKKPPMSKTAFVKSLPASMPGPEVVKEAKEAGLSIGLNYVYSIRARTNPKRKRKAVPTAAVAAPVKRGPGRPPKSASNGNGSSGVGNAGGLEAAIEAIVERKVNEILKGKLGALFG